MHFVGYLFCREATGTHLDNLIFTWSEVRTLMTFGYSHIMNDAGYVTAKIFRPIGDILNCTTKLINRHCLADKSVNSYIHQATDGLLIALSRKHKYLNLGILDSQLTGNIYTRHLRKHDIKQHHIHHATLKHFKQLPARSCLSYYLKRSIALLKGTAKSYSKEYMVIDQHYACYLSIHFNLLLQ